MRGESHIPPTSHTVTTIDQHIDVAHNRMARGWTESLIDLSASFGEYLKMFQTTLRLSVRPDNEEPVILEVFCDMKSDGELCLSVYRELEREIEQELFKVCHD